MACDVLVHPRGPVHRPGVTWMERLGDAVRRFQRWVTDTKRRFIRSLRRRY